MAKKNLVGQLFGYVKAEGKWMLLPLFLILLLVGVLFVMTAGSALAPFIYSIF